MKVGAGVVGVGSRGKALGYESIRSSRCWSPGKKLTEVGQWPTLSLPLEYSHRQTCIVCPPDTQQKQVDGSGTPEASAAQAFVVGNAFESGSEKAGQGRL